MGSNPTVTANEKGPASLCLQGKQGLLFCSQLVVCPHFAHTRQGKARGGHAENVDDLESTGDRVLSSGNHGVEVQTCNRTSWSNLAVRAPTYSGMMINGGTIHSVAGPMISGGANASYDAIRATGTSHLSVSGGYLASLRYAVYATTTDWVTLTGIDMHDAAQAARFSLDATNKITAPNLV
jgi:hypothetical protein